jgi:outer membrane protein OmpA-like peptidoglycan-associated protein
VINVIVVFILLCLVPTRGYASPAQSGSSGLLTVSSAETLDAGNICIGIWSCYAENSTFSQKSSLIIPATITLGIGTFWEVYGAYPNLFFNGDEDISGRGTLDIGTKLRFLGERSANFKIAVDLLGQRRISESREIDGVTDLSGKLVVSYVTGAFGVHASGGYMKPGSYPGVNPDPGYTFSAGVEYMAIPRLKLLGEVFGSTNRYYVTDPNPVGTPEGSRLPLDALSGRSIEASVGFQYFLNPHLTLNTSVGSGFGEHDPELKVLFGISTCQGVGTYVKPIPTVGQRSVAKDKSKDTIKPLKIIPISSLLLKPSAPQTSPVGKLEVELEAEKEEILIKPYGQIVIAPQQASSNLTAPVIPVDIPQNGRPEGGANTIPTAAPQGSDALDAAQSQAKGITPLFGVDIKGAQVAIPAAVVAPERMTVYRKFRFPDVTFEADQSELSVGAKKMLSEVAEQIRKDKKWRYVKVEGHTDGIGSLPYNMDLSLQRAIAAATYLISHEGVDPAKVFVKGLGKTAPIADNSTAAGRRKNSRIELQLLVPAEESQQP